MQSRSHAALDAANDREGWIRCKLLAGLPLDPAEEAYLASLPPGDPLLQQAGRMPQRHAPS